MPTSACRRRPHPGGRGGGRSRGGGPGGRTRRRRATAPGSGGREWDAIAPDRSIGRYALDLIRRPRCRGNRSRGRASRPPLRWRRTPKRWTPSWSSTVRALRETRAVVEALPGLPGEPPPDQESPRSDRAPKRASRLLAGPGASGRGHGYAGRMRRCGLQRLSVSIRTPPSGRRALVGYGDARLRLGDTAGAAPWLTETVVSDAVQTDSIYQMALDRLEELRGSAPFDSVRTILR